MTNYNIYSPEGPEIHQASKREINQFARNLKNQLASKYTNNLTEAKGYFGYETRPKLKKQFYRMNIETAEDAVIIATLLTDRTKINPFRLPRQYMKIYNIFNNANLNDNNFIYSFYNKLEPWLKKNILTSGRKKDEKKITNPLTGRMIKRNAPTYKQVFRNIKLKHINYDKLERYDTTDYDIIENCVPSYILNNLKLTKKEREIIEPELDENKQPTTEQLEIMLNKIGYGLISYITDFECISGPEQNEFKKNIKIMIHDEHMYILKRPHDLMNTCKVKEINKDEFDDMNSEFHTHDMKIKNGYKYKILDRFKPVANAFLCKSSFSQSNIDFYETCKIRAPRYLNLDIENKQSLDIKKAYYNILHNQTYRLPVQNGTEKTEKYNTNDLIIDTSFYYVQFKRMNDIDTAIFETSKCWIMGYLINNLKLKPRIDILFKHVVAGCNQNNINEDSEELKYMDVIHYTGTLCNYTKTKEKIIQCWGDEKEAYLIKYESEDPYYKPGQFTLNDTNETTEYNSIHERNKLMEKHKNKDYRYTNPHITISRDYLMQNSGLYAYLGIMQLIRYELYHLINEIKKCDNTVKVHKIYTDCVTYNKTLTEPQIKNINKVLMKKGFSVSVKQTDHTWDYEPLIVDEPVISNESINNNYKIDDIYNLINNKKSFCINAKAGYGKSYSIKNMLLPYLEQQKIKYVLTSTTIKSSELLGCQCINTLLSSNESSNENIKKMFNSVKYLIIDECSRLNEHILKMIEYVKNETKCKIIMVGDQYQCDFSMSEVMKSSVFNNIIDNNWINMTWSKNARYCKAYDTFLSKILTYQNGGSDPECMKLIRSQFKKQIHKIGDEDNNKIKLSYTHKTGRTLDDYMTVHKSQGETINESYSIYECDRMPLKVLYTALSRCTNTDQIHIYL